MWAVTALIFVLALVGAGVVLYMRSAASKGAALAQREAQLQEETERRLANEEVDRVERAAQESEFADEATAVVSPADALKLLREAAARLR